MPPVQFSTAATQDVPSRDSCWPAPQTGPQRSCGPPKERVPAGQVQMLFTSVAPPPHVLRGGLGAATGPGPVRGLPSSPTHCSPPDPTKVCAPAGQVHLPPTSVAPPPHVAPDVALPEPGPPVCALPLDCCFAGFFAACCFCLAASSAACFFCLLVSSSTCLFCLASSSAALRGDTFSDEAAVPALVGPGA